MIATAPDLIDLTPEMLERLETFAREHADDPLGDIGGTVLFEDDRVRLWELVLQPGEASDLHRHDHDYYLLVVEGDYVAAVPHPYDPDRSIVGKVPELGNTVPMQKGMTEWAYNVGEKVYREFIVELKQT